MGDGTGGQAVVDEQRPRPQAEAARQAAASLAHSLNNTIQGIMGNIELARMQAPDDIKIYIENALLACGEATRLIRGLALSLREEASRADDILAPSPEPPVKFGSPVVLVVDDDDIVRDSVARVLRFGGLSVFSAPNGAEALDFIARAAPLPALVLLDQEMPGIDGTTVRRQIHKLAPGIKVIMISGHAADQMDTEGVEAVLEKPVRAEALLETVRSMLGVVRTPS